jgi:RsiW-degrading membrane proteinase PrsW (M82 family)
MPSQDPIPNRRYAVIRRFWRIFRLLALLSVVIAAIAVFFVIRGETSPSIHLIIATALGAGLTVLLGTALMTLVFLSSESGYDEAPRIDQESDPE